MKQELSETATFTHYTVKTNGLKKKCCGVYLENHIFPNIFTFETCHLYLDTGSNNHSRELLVGHTASMSSLFFIIICAFVTFQFFIMESLFDMLKRLDCRKDTFNYTRINFSNIYN